MDARALAHRDSRNNDRAWHEFVCRGLDGANLKEGVLTSLYWQGHKTRSTLVQVRQRIGKKKSPPKAGVPKTLHRSVTLFPPCEAFFPHRQKLAHRLDLCHSFRPIPLLVPNPPASPKLVPITCSASLGADPAEAVSV